MLYVPCMQDKTLDFILMYTYVDVLCMSRSQYIWHQLGAKLGMHFTRVTLITKCVRFYWAIEQQTGQLNSMFQLKEPSPTACTVQLWYENTIKHCVCMCASKLQVIVNEWTARTWTQWVMIINTTNIKPMTVRMSKVYRPLEFLEYIIHHAAEVVDYSCVKIAPNTSGKFFKTADELFKHHTVHKWGWDNLLNFS